MIINKICVSITKDNFLLSVGTINFSFCSLHVSSFLNVSTTGTLVRRSLTYYPCRKQEGHRIELMLGKHRKRKINPPVVPVHPNEEKKKNLNNFITYKDLKIRWRNTSQNYRKKVTIARKWKNLHCLLPMNKPSCIFILHKNLPFTRIRKGENDVNPIYKDTQTKGVLNENKRVDIKGYEQKDEETKTKPIIHREEEIVKVAGRGRKKTKRELNRTDEDRKVVKDEGVEDDIEEVKSEGEYYERPPKKLLHILKDTKDMFCIFKSNFINEHKVTIGDIVQTEKLHRRKAGDVVYFGTVLFAGSKDFSIIGKPTIPYCKVKAVIEQITLSQEILSFRYKKVRRSSTFLRTKHWITILKIEDILFDFRQNNTIKDERIKPLRILDLWANRWLYQKELNFIKFNEKNNRPMAEQIYDLIEHQPNTLHRRGMTECYRFYPDPHAAHTY